MDLTAQATPSAGYGGSDRMAATGADRIRVSVRMAVPTLLLAIVLLYPLLLTQLLSGAFLHAGDLDAQINVEAASSNAINQAFWLSIFAVCAATAALRQKSLLPYLLTLWPLLLYLAWSAATMLWAVDRHVASRRLILQFCIVGSIWLPIAMMANAAHVRRVVLYMLLGVVMLNTIAAVAIPRTALGYAGFFGQKNELGAVMAIALITFLTTTMSVKSRVDRTAALVGIPLATFLLVYSRSKTSFILALAVPLLAYGIYFTARTLRIRPGLVIAGSLVSGIFAVAAAFGSGLRYEDLLKIFFHDATFTGRTEIWSFAWSNIVTKPLAGFGFNGFWGVGGGSAATSADNAFLANILQAHNGYLDTLLETGFIGLAILAGFIIVSLKHCSRLLRTDAATGIFCLAITLFFVLHNLEESSAFRRFEPTWVLFLVAAIAAAQPLSSGRRQLRSNPAQWAPAC
jgi:exopolysaccharide production protein ExoQ